MKAQEQLYMIIAQLILSALVVVTLFSFTSGVLSSENIRNQLIASSNAFLVEAMHIRGGNTEITIYNGENSKTSVNNQRVLVQSNTGSFQEGILLPEEKTIDEYTTQNSYVRIIKNQNKLTLGEANQNEETTCPTPTKEYSWNGAHVTGEQANILKGLLGGVYFSQGITMDDFSSNGEYKARVRQGADLRVYTEASEYGEVLRCQLKQLLGEEVIETGISNQYTLEIQHSKPLSEHTSELTLALQNAGGKQ